MRNSSRNSIVSVVSKIVGDVDLRIGNLGTRLMICSSVFPLLRPKAFKVGNSASSVSLTTAF